MPVPVLTAEIVTPGNAAPLALVGPGFADAATWIGVAFSGAVVVLSYRWVARQGVLGPGAGAS